MQLKMRMKSFPFVITLLVVLSFECCKKDNNQGVIQFDVNGVTQYYTGASGRMVIYDTLKHPNKIIQIFSDTFGTVPFILLSIGESSLYGIIDSLTPGRYPNDLTNTNCLHGYNELCQGFGALYVDTSAQQWVTLNNGADTASIVNITSCSAVSHLIRGTFTCLVRDETSVQPNMVITNGRFINVPYSP